MKRFISAVLASLMLTGAFVACGEKDASAPVTTVATTSSEADVYAKWLADRLGYEPQDVVLGIGSDDKFGIDLSNFESDGYILRTVGKTTLIFGKTADGLDRAVRAYAKAVDAGRTDTLNETYHEGVRVERLTIAGRDISEYTVYYPETANENMKFAADELVRLVEIATGVTLPIVVGAPVFPAIELRHTDDPALETDGYRYEVTEDGLIIEGAVTRGCMNGVWRFLQLECGWDYLIYGNSYLNESDHVDIPVGTARTEEPAFEHFNMWNRYDNFINDRAVPNEAQNGYGNIGTASHNIAQFYGGNAEGDHPCYTSDEFYDNTLYNIEKFVAANYGKPGFYVNIGQNDSASACMCETCTEVFLEEGGHSGAVVRHANYVSEEINKLYPGTYFTIFAYAGSNAPPKVTKPNEWLYITFCTDWCCSNHRIDGSDCKDTVYFYDRNNKTYAEWLEGWCSVSDNVYVYAYNLGKGLDEYTVINNVYDDYTYFHRIGVKGICLEGSDYGNWGIKRLEQMLISEINWNPHMTREEATEIYHDLLRYEYGDGWELVLDYIDQWELSQDLANCWAWWDISPTDQKSRNYYTGFFAARFDNFIEILDAALLMANSSAQEEMVKRLSVSMLYKGCYSSYFLAYLANDTERLEELSALYDRCMNTLIELGEDPENLKGHYDQHFRHYSLNIEEIAWTNEQLCWAELFFVLTGRQIPEDAPASAK